MTDYKYIIDTILSTSPYFQGSTILLYSDRLELKMTFLKEQQQTLFTFIIIQDGRVVLIPERSYGEVNIATCTEMVNIITEWLLRVDSITKQEKLLKEQEKLLKGQDKDTIDAIQGLLALVVAQ